MLRKFPPQTAFVKPNFNMPPNQPMHYPNQPVNIEGLDKNDKRDYYGEILYTKISSNEQFGRFSEYFSKIVGIFLDLEPHVIERLIHDDNYFGQQVFETIRLLNEKTGN